MGTELAVVQDFTPDQMNLITNTIAKNATKEELELFLYRCKNMGLDPLKSGQIHFIKYGNSAGTIVVGVEGFRAVAHRTGKLSGIKRGVTRDEKGQLISAWAEVYRSDWQHPAREEVPFSEYNTGKGPWAKMPETMLKKCAECATLRMAFPNDLGGVYVDAEMDQAGKAKEPLPPPKQSLDPVPFRIHGSGLAARAIGEIPEPELRMELERLELIASPSEDQQRTMDRMREHLSGLAASVFPKCTCGSELKLASHGRSYYCPDFNNTQGKHIRPMPKAEYEGGTVA